VRGQKVLGLIMGTATQTKSGRAMRILRRRAIFLKNFFNVN
jgi:hypothetical protein